MDRFGAYFGLDLRLSLKIVLAALVVLAILITLGHDTVRPDADWWRWGRLVVWLYALSLIILVLDRLQPDVCRWFTAFALVASVHLGVRWLGMPHYLSLVGIPVGLATPLVGFPLTLALGLLETVVLGLGWSAGDGRVEPSTTVLALSSLWGTIALVYAVYGPRHRLDNWLWGYFTQAQRVLKEERDQRADLKQALDDLSYANRQLALANERLADLRLVAEEAQKAKSAFVAKVSHEFRTPLNMIMGLVGLLVEEPELHGQALPPPVLEDLHIIHRNCDHLASMINDVLALSQAEAGRLALHREWVDLSEIVDAAGTVVQPLLDKKRLDLKVAIPAGLPPVYCDRARIRQVILNLVSNAARFTEQGGITVSVDQGSQAVTVSVRDTGPGIAPEDAERIFEPFCQGSGDLWREKRGTGLGLSISKEFVQRHGGRIWLESELGKGTTFSFELPISQPLDLVDKPTRWIKEEWIWYERKSRPDLPEAHYRPRALVYDQSGDLCSVLGRLSDDAEWVEARELAQVVRELEDAPAHVILANAPAPAQLWSTVEQVRREVRDTPIVGCAVPPRLAYVLEAHALDYLVKPVARDRLQSAVAKVGAPIDRVLLVDDDPDVLQLWTRILHIGDPELEILTASSGAEALAVLRAEQPDLVLLDIILPDMDGWQVLAFKRQDASIRDIPVILVSAQDPVGQPLASDGLLLTMGKGLPLAKLLRGTLELSALMLKPD